MLSCGQLRSSARWPKAYSPTSAPAVRLPLRRVIEIYSRQYTGKKRGWRQETNRVKAWLRDPLTEWPIAKIRSRDIATWIKDQGARGLAPSTIKNALQIASQA